MKVRIEFEPELEENEILIRCKKLDETTQKIQQSIADIIAAESCWTFYKTDQKKGDTPTEYFLPLEQILFFETSQSGISAHTAEDMYETKYKLYELEEKLPGYFMRISKSTIINVNHIYAITRNLTASSAVEFVGTHKQVYVSRLYYKPLKERLEEKRLRV